MLVSLIHAIRHTLKESAGPVVVTVSGPSGSGKTTVVYQIIETLNTPVSVLHTDDYYIGKTRMRTHMPDGEEQNFDHPASMDLKRLATDIDTLKQGNSVTSPVYSMFFSEPTKDTRRVDATQLIIIEGIAANTADIRALSDISVCVTAPYEERLERCIRRDSERAGRAADEQYHYFQDHVEPSYQKHFARDDRQVDFMIRN